MKDLKPKKRRKLEKKIRRLKRQVSHLYAETRARKKLRPLPIRVVDYTILMTVHSVVSCDPPMRPSQGELVKRMGQLWSLMPDSEKAQISPITESIGRILGDADLVPTASPREAPQVSSQVAWRDEADRYANLLADIAEIVEVPTLIWTENGEELVDAVQALARAAHREEEA